MTDEWNADVGQLRLIGGARVESPGNLLVAERRSLFSLGGRKKGRLHVLIELSGTLLGREELAEDIATAVSQEYMQSPGTVTYGLRQAVLLANTELFRANMRLAEERRIGGIACVVLRDGEVFIAQAGWPVVYLVHEDRVQAFPDTTLDVEDTTMLGQRHTTEVRLFRTSVQSGDTILMVDGPMARQLGITRIGQIVSGGIEHAVGNLETLAPPEDCSAMVIQVGEASAPDVEVERWAFRPVEPPPLDQEPLAAAEPKSAPSEEYDLGSDLAGQETMPDLAQEPLTMDADASQGPDLASARRRRRIQRHIPQVNEWLTQAWSRLGQSARTLGERLLPDRQPARTAGRRRRRPARGPGRARQRPQTRWGVAAVIALPVLVLLFALGYNGYRNWSLRTQFEERLASAKEMRDMALASAESPALARDYWLGVITKVDEAAELQPNNQELPPLKVQALSEIDRIDGVTRLDTIYHLYTYADPESKSKRVLVAGLDVFVLDRGTNRVYRHTLTQVRNALRDPEGDQVLVEQGQTVAGQSVGALLDMAWMREGGDRQTGMLVILDRNGLLIEYDPAWEGELDGQVIGGQELWRSPIAVRTFDGNLYVLDSAANQVFKYWKGQFASPPTPWIQDQNADLSKAIDLAIDGNIMILFQDGRIAKYFGGNPVPFAQTQIPKPLVWANAIYFDVEEVVRHMYIVDAAGPRVVQLDREGVFVRQLQPALGYTETFRDLGGVFVDETAGKLYYVAAPGLFVSDIPPVLP